MSELYCLVEQEIPRLRRYARALTRSSDRADDLVQDTLLRALTKLHLWQPGTDIRAWLFTIMHHQYVNTVRREARETASVDIEHLSSNLVATTDPTARRQLVELDRALAQLSADQREILLLVGLEGMDYESVAQILDVPVGTVRSRLSRGRERLRELMGGDRRLGRRPDTEATTTQPNTDASHPKSRPMEARPGLKRLMKSAAEFAAAIECGPHRTAVATIGPAPAA